MDSLRVGFGYDIHRLVKGRRLVLGGDEIPHESGLEGHSDADVVCHALADAILGAVGLGDIGRHFPPDDPQWRDADSVDLLRRVTGLAAGQRATIVNADVTVVAEAPRLAPHVDAMRRRTAGAMGTTPDRISIKATTREGLGPEGERRAISAHAVALIRIADV
jgi:2-C-methyl-D-erythritol 2,4-cyclodiphosphate synthase